MQTLQMLSATITGVGCSRTECISSWIRVCTLFLCWMYILSCHTEQWITPFQPDIVIISNHYVLYKVLINVIQWCWHEGRVVGQTPVLSHMTDVKMYNANHCKKWLASHKFHSHWYWHQGQPGLNHWDGGAALRVRPTRLPPLCLTWPTKVIKTCLCLELRKTSIEITTTTRFTN